MTKKGNFDRIIGGHQPVLVDFSAEWCGPCRAMGPILDDLKAQMGAHLRIIKIDVDRSPALAQRFQISGVPTLILFQDGVIRWRQSGVMPARVLQARIEEQLAA